MNRFILNLAKFCAPLRQLLSMKIDWKWEEEHENAFQTLKKEIQKTSEKNFSERPNLYGLSATPVLQQKKEEGWITTHFALLFLTTFEQKYSTKKLKHLANVCLIEHFRNYVYGIQFDVVSDHKPLTANLKGNRADKVNSKRLRSSVNKHLRFHFTVKHSPGTTLGMANFLSKHPSPSN